MIRTRDPVEELARLRARIARLKSREKKLSEIVGPEPAPPARQDRITQKPRPPEPANFSDGAEEDFEVIERF